jgi:hypothetical protein
MLAALSMASFRQAAGIFPILLALHFAEEAPRFAAWAWKFASPRYTRVHWAKIHGLGLVWGVVATAVVALFANSYVVFLFLALCAGPMAFNAVFHAGATAYFRAYCPGVITAVAIFPLFVWYLAHLALRDGLLSPTAALVALLLAGPLHAIDVASTVFFVKPSATYAPSVKS